VETISGAGTLLNFPSSWEKLGGGCRKWLTVDI